MTSKFLLTTCALLVSLPPANRLRTRSDGRLHVRRPPERSRWQANAARHTGDASARSAAISTLSGCHGLGM
jgi:hypothetical protein